MFFARHLIGATSKAVSTSSWTPASITGQLLWLEGNSGYTDKFGVTTVSNVGSTIESGILNGLDVFRFNASLERIDIGSGTGILGASYSIFVVFNGSNWRTASDDHVLFSQYSSSQSGRFFFGARTNSGTTGELDVFEGGGSGHTDGSVLSTSQWYIAHFINDNKSVEGFLGNVSDFSNTFTNNAPNTQNTIGAYDSSGGGQFEGDIAEIIIYSDAKDSTDQSDVYNYLKSKYGL